MPTHCFTRLPGFHWAFLCLFACGCGAEPPAPRNVKTIAEEKAALPVLYMTVSGQRREAPANSPPMVDAQSKEIYWPALECTHPQCPGRTAEGGPFLFVHPDPGSVVDANGKVSFREADPSEYKSAECPKCLEKRNLASEAPATKSEYVSAVASHVLPATAAKMKQLDEEAQKLLQRK